MKHRTFYRVFAVVAVAGILLSAILPSFMAY